MLTDMQRSIVLVLRTRISNVTAVHSRAVQKIALLSSARAIAEHALSKRLEFRASVCPKWGGRVVTMHPDTVARRSWDTDKRTVISLPPKPPSPAQPHPADVPPKNTTLAPPTSSSSPRKAMFDATQTFDAAMEDWISLSAELEAAKRVELAARTALCNSEEVLSQVQHLLYSENASLTGVAEMLDDAQLSYDRFVAEAAVALGFQTGQVYELAAVSPTITDKASTTHAGFDTAGMVNELGVSEQRSRTRVRGKRLGRTAKRRELQLIQVEMERAFA